jgi:hypothetical protein
MEQINNLYHILLGWANQGKYDDHIVSCLENMRNAYKVMFGKPEGSKYLTELGIDGKTKLKGLL